MPSPLDLPRVDAVWVARLADSRELICTLTSRAATVAATAAHPDPDAAVMREAARQQLLREVAAALLLEAGPALLHGTHREH